MFKIPDLHTHTAIQTFIIRRENIPIWREMRCEAAINIFKPFQIGLWFFSIHRQTFIIRPEGGKTFPDREEM